MRRLSPVLVVLLGVLALALALVSPARKQAPVLQRPVKMSDCPGSSAEVEQAVAGASVYEAWIGCGGIGFARSTDGGRTFGPTQIVPGSSAGRFHAWDPAVAVAPDGTVYVSFMLDSPAPGRGAVKRMAPVVAVSDDGGRTFARHTALPVPATGRSNWGDRDFVAVAPDGTVYVTWDYGPRADQVRLDCSSGGSCSYAAGDFNAVIQHSHDGGRTWSALTHVSPGFPLGGVYSAPVLVEPDGALDVLYVAHPTDSRTQRVAPGGEFFTRSTDGGATWSAPVAVAPQVGTISLAEWWIDGSLAADPAGNLYAAWDTQSGPRDVAWLAWSSDHGRTWSAPMRVSAGSGEQLVEVAAAGEKDVFVAWQAVVPRRGYATFLRRLAVGAGWTGPAVRVSTAYGRPKIWPGDTFGLSTSGGTALLSWGSAVGTSRRSAIWFAAAALPS